MMGKKDNAERTQMEIASLEDLVPRNHLVRKLDEAIDMSFIYEEVKDLYSDIVNIGLHFFLKNVRPYAASCSEA